MSRQIGVLLFDGFELLDVFGPVELWSRLSDRYEVTFCAVEPGPVRSSQGATVMATEGTDSCVGCDIVLVPGGPGTRSLVADHAFLARLRGWAAPASIISSVCTGSAMLAAAGLLEGYRATSNKMAYAWASSHGQDVRWEPRARWVHDRDRWTSSGVAAGMDMTAALIEYLEGKETAERVLQEVELEVQTDPDRDPFAVTDDRATASNR
ncbi:DJ-1/PfpI family protein [Cutibacterium equinum]|uniref:DJ-1/PfpI family protein n=1 Tax=Cutibacterium equinum TaxID=3016342 RepID=A0ABY7QZI2_9ACTN|nr:DJ-1/PfpI family protein [Cutibacterium equinum]WCC80458.1 DJ-1/PfpI family protein [Cutibacterium equinum]